MVGAGGVRSARRLATHDGRRDLHAVVPQVGQEGAGDDADLGHGEEGGARGAAKALAGEPGHEGADGGRVAADGGVQQVAAPGPGGGEGEADDADGEGEPGAVEELEAARGDEEAVDDEEGAHEAHDGGDGRGRAVVPAPAGGDEGGEEAVDGHGHGHRHAVGRGQRRRPRERRRHDHHRRHHCPRRGGFSRRGGGGSAARRRRGRRLKGARVCSQSRRPGGSG